MISPADYPERVVGKPSYFHLPFYEALRLCERCTCRPEARQVVPGEGPQDAEFLVLGQNPGDEEDHDGRPFVGRGGKELDTWLLRLGLDRQKILVTNAVKCHTTENRAPKRVEILACTDYWLRQEVEAFTKLQALFTLGKPATAVVLGKMKTPTMDPFWVRVKFGERILHCIPLPHPAYILRAAAKRPELFSRVLPAVKDYLGRELPEAYSRARL